MEPPDKRQKFSINAILEAIGVADKQLDVARSIFHQWAGYDFKKIKEDSDLLEAKVLIKKIEASISKLKSNWTRDRTFRRTSLNKTWLKRINYSFFERPHELRTIDEEDEENEDSDEEEEEEESEDDGIIDLMDFGEEQMQRTSYRKSLLDCKPDTRLKRTANIYQVVITEAQLQMISLEQLAAYLCYRFLYMQYKKKAKQYYDVFHGFDFTSKPKYNVEQSLHFCVRNRLSQVAYNRNRLNLLPVLVLMPYNNVSQHRRFICPKLEEYQINVIEEEMQEVMQPDGSIKATMAEKAVSKSVGVFCNLGQALEITMQRLLKSNWEVIFSKDLRNLVLSIRTGLDAAGDQKQYHQRSQRNMDTSHLLSIMYVTNEVFAPVPKQG